MACGSDLVCLLASVELDDALSTEEFLEVGVFGPDGRRFQLSRYFDHDYSENGPNGLAAFLNLSVEEVFPISYDISAVAVGIPDVVRGVILAAPRRRLTEDERMELAVRGS
jgi:hypothetical protein